MVIFVRSPGGLAPIWSLGLARQLVECIGLAVFFTMDLMFGSHDFRQRLYDYSKL